MLILLESLSKNNHNNLISSNVRKPSRGFSGYQRKAGQQYKLYKSLLLDNNCYNDTMLQW